MTACKTCVFTEMSKFTAGGTIQEAKEITGNFKCTLCKHEKYSLTEIDKQVPIKINIELLEMLDEFDENLPVTCDRFPASLVNWYNKKSKNVVSNDVYFSSPAQMDDHIQINRKVVDQFYAKAKESLIGFNATLTNTINQITKFTSEELALQASAFLKLSS